MREHAFKYMLVVGAVWLGLISGAVAVQAAPMELNFTANSFQSTPLPGTTPPTDPVSGTIIFDGSATGDITSLTSISLTIDGYSYSRSDVDSICNSSSIFGVIYGGCQIGGVNDLVTGVAAGTNDFVLAYTTSPSVGPAFLCTPALRSL
jgi:hypothetical protein